MLYDLRTTREHVVFSRRQQADAGRCETELHVVGAVQFPEKRSNFRIFEVHVAASARVARRTATLACLSV